MEDTMNNYMNFAEGEITIYCAHDVRHGVETSLDLAMSLGRKGKVLYLNTAFTNRKFLASARSAAPEGLVNVHAYNIRHGGLASELGWIARTMKEQKMQYLVINAWEYAHTSYLEKERTIFSLMGMLNDLGITVLVYSNVNPEKVKAGKIQRGTLGKLSGLADQIIEVKQQVEQASPLVSEAAIAPEGRPAGRPYDKLETLKINELDYARSESGVSSIGELILT